MSSTRLNNDKVEYCKRQREIRLAEQFSLYKYKCISNDTAFPAAGINMPKMINGYNNNILSQNAPDIESALFGIGSTNLVNAKQPVVTKLNKMETKHFFDRPDTFIPEPLVIEKSQRPRGPFC